MPEEKNIIDEFKEMIDYTDEIFEKDGQGLVSLERKIERNESYVKFVLYMAKAVLNDGMHPTLKDIAKNIGQDASYVYKMMELFLAENLFVVIKKSHKNYYHLNMNDENLKAFMALFKKAKAMRDE